MILSDKIIHHRKKNGWTQEDLAEQMNVSRQAVSKWESAASIPDLDKILRLSEIFGVTADYLIKDEYEPQEIEPAVAAPDGPQRPVSLDEANRFLDLRQKIANLKAWGVALCILPLAVVILFDALTQVPGLPWLAASTSSLLSIILVGVMIATAAVLLSKARRADDTFRFFEDTPIDTEYGVDGIVKKQRDTYLQNAGYRKSLGIALAILAVVPILLSDIVFPENLPHQQSLMVCASIVLAAVAAFILVRDKTLRQSFAMVLEEGNFSKDKKVGAPDKERMRRARRTVSAIYWILAIGGSAVWYLYAPNHTALTLAWGIILVLFPVVLLITNAIARNKQ